MVVRMTKPTRLLFRLALAITILIGGSILSLSAASPGPERKGPITHIGVIWLKEPGNADHRQRLISALHSFAREIPEVKALSVGRPQFAKSKLVDDTFDVCFSMQFEDYAALERYAANPVHEKAAHEEFLPLSQKILFYDFINE